MLSSRSLIALLVLTTVTAAGCGRVNHYCRSVAPRTDMAVGEALRTDSITRFFTGNIRTIDQTDLNAAIERTHDARFEELSSLVVIYPLTSTLDARVAEHFGRGETDAAGNPRPNREKLLRIQELGNELRQEYCGLENPMNRCMNAIGRLAFGVNEHTISACQNIKTEAAARCAEIAARHNINSIDSREISACAAYYHPNHADCLSSVSQLSFGINEATINACSNVWRTNGVRCVSVAVRQSVNSIDARAIDACAQ